MASGLQVVTEFTVQVRRFVLINSDPDPVMSRWGGVRIHIPGRAQTIRPLAGDPDRFVSATDRDGSYVPGTLVITDRYKQDENGDDVLSFDAGQAVRYILGVNPRNGVATSVFAQRGLSLLPTGSTRADLERIRQAGYERSEGWRIQQARILISDVDQANAKREKAKVPPIPGGRDYVEAVMLLRAAHAKEQELMKRVLTPEADEPVEPVPPPQPEEIDEDAELLDFLRDRINAAAPKETKEDDKAALVEKLINDPEAMAILKQKYQVVKRLRPVSPPKKRGGQDVSLRERGFRKSRETPAPPPPVSPEQAVVDATPGPSVAPPEAPLEHTASSVGMGGPLPDSITSLNSEPEDEEIPTE